MRVHQVLCAHAAAAVFAYATRFEVPRLAAKGGSCVHRSFAEMPYVDSTVPTIADPGAARATPFLAQQKPLDTVAERSDGKEEPVTRRGVQDSGIAEEFGVVPFNAAVKSAFSGWNEDGRHPRHADDARVVPVVDEDLRVSQIPLA